MKRRVLYFTDSDGFGGTEQVMLSLIAGLDPERWEPVLLHHGAPGILPLVEGARALGVEARRVPPMNGAEGARRLAGFVRLIRSYRASVFHAHLTMPLRCKYGLAGAFLARVPAVVASEHLFVNVPYRSSLLVERLVSPCVDRYLPVSRQVARALVDQVGLPANKMTVVHNGIPLEAFAEKQSTQRSGPGQGNGSAPVVLTVARLTTQKGIGYLLQAAAQVPDARFLIAGNGPERSLLLQRAQGLGLAGRVSFLGKRDDVPALLRQADIFVLPSLYEGLPVSVLEAMAAGTPVIATDVGGTGEAITHCETGMLIPPADPAALARALRELLDNPSLRQSLGAAGRERVRAEFSVERMCSRVQAIYDEILAKRGAS